MKKWKRVPVIALIVVLLAMMGTQVATAEMLDMNQFNDDTITVSKVPKGKAGNKISIKMTIHNKGTKGDNDLKKIRLANSYEYERIMERQFGEADDSDEGELRWYDKSFPFEADSTTFKEKDINVKPGSSKSVTLSYKLRRDLTAGYYQAFFIIDDSIEVGVNIWVSAYDGSTEEDDNTKLDYDFAIGENQFTPSASYSQVMNFGVNLRNSGLKKVYDVRVDMQLDPDITKFPFDINEGNYLRYMGDMDPEQTVTVPYSMAVREEVTAYYPVPH